MNVEEPRYQQLSEPILDHKHTYHVVLSTDAATGPFTIRYCPTCGKSWSLEQRYGKWYWQEILERQPED